MLKNLIQEQAIKYGSIHNKWDEIKEDDEINIINKYKINSWRQY